MSVPVIAIDGPSGAGKGTVSRAVAKQLRWNYLDSGSIYRSLAIAAIKQDVDIEDIYGLTQVAESMLLGFECEDELIVKLNNIDITADLASETTGNRASIIAAYPQIREVLLQKQRDFQQQPGLVADGRDMGTVVFPEANYKVYLTASAEKRAKRRYKQLIEKGIDANIVEINKEIELRDRRDKERSTAPLKIAGNAVFIDSSDLTIKYVVDWVLSLVH